jgi:fructosamine-3-kinase
MPGRHRKQSSAAPPGYFAWEASGLRWLAEARDAGGAAVVDVLDEGPSHLDLALLAPGPPTPAAAERLGRGLAATHAAGATAHGCGPPAWVGDGWLGPLSEPLPLPLGEWPTWGAFYAQARITPLLAEARARGVLDAAGTAVLERLAARVGDGAFDTGEPPARLHGDLWAGNVLWTSDTAVLIDPAAHGGHREADLAMLALFGAPHLERVLAAYAEAAPLADGWRDRVRLHQVHPLLLHAVLFGGGYGAQAVRAAARYV